jgi:hypothetical protein
MLSGWWLSIFSEKYDGKNNPNVPKHQPDIGCLKEPIW